MWRLALGIAVLLQAGTTSAGQQDEEPAASDARAAPVECSSGSADEDCTADEVTVPDAPPAAPAVAAPAAPAPTAFATVSFRNDVGKGFRLVEAEFAMDGEKLPVVLTSAEPGKSYVIVSGAMKPGQHVVSARLTYRGDGGVFSYMKGYKLNVRSVQVLNAPADRAASFTVVGRETKGITVPIEKRLVISVEDAARSQHGAR